jgi:putative ABC transport system permease protein
MFGSLGSFGSFGTLASDLRFALRMLWRSPGVTAAAVLALALGIGANTAIFSVVQAVLLRPLPFPDSQTLYRVNTSFGKVSDPHNQVSYPQYQDLVARTRTLEGIAGWYDGDANLSGAAAPERVLLRVATPSLLPTLRVQPVRGRNFVPDETTAGRTRVALIAHGLWKRQFAGREDVLGQTLRLDEVDYRIIGVLPRGFQLEESAQDPIAVWIPLDTSDPDLKVRNAHFLEVIARSHPGVPAAAVAADLAAVARYETESFPDMFPASASFAFAARPFLDVLVRQVRLPLLVLLGAVGFVLLIACANVANLLLARAPTREREMAIRTALGARRARLVRQLLTESVLLSVIGAALGILFASWGIQGLLALSPGSVPRLEGVGLDVRVLLFTALVAVATGVAFGLVPALSQSRPQVHDALKQGMYGTSAGRGRLRGALVVTEVALSLVLLIGAGLMVRSFIALQRLDPGFRPDHALMVRVSLPIPDRTRVTAADQERFVSFFARALGRLRQLPGVVAAGACNGVPLAGSRGDRLIDIENDRPRERADRPHAQNRQATPGWFEAVGIPLLRGRAFQERDQATAPRVVVVNQAFARRWFPDGEPIGRRLRLGRLTDDFPWATIVGVVGDVHAYGLDVPPMPEMYWAVAQSPGTPALAVVVRTAGDPLSLAGPVRAAIAEIDPAQPVFDLQTLEQVVGSSLGQRRFTLTLMLVFGLIALVLAAVGIYGVMAYTVAQRTREIGIRVALGARAGTVVGMVLRDGMKLVALGVVLGTASALAVTRVARTLLYGVSAADSLTYVVIAVLLSAVGLAAIVIPALRATRIDPMRALRTE